MKQLSTFRTLRNFKFPKCSQRPGDELWKLLQLYNQKCVLHMIGYLKYFTNNLCKRHHSFRTVGLVRTVKILCDVTVVYANDSLHRVCFPTVIKSIQDCIMKIIVWTNISQCGPSCSKLTTSLVNVLLKFQTLILQIH